MKWTNEATGRTIEIYNEDCMPALSKMHENEFELAIVDPPYGIGINKQSLGEGGGLYRQPKTYKRGDWDNNIPTEKYFIELQRCTQNQIIWGANHYISKIPYDSSCWIVWDKNNGATDFADCELAWTSFKSPVRKYKYTWSGFVQQKMGKDKESKIHPTQKPVALYKWLLKNYAKEKDRILDTHLGSGSIAIACWEMGFDLVGYELDTDYFEATCKRLNDHFNQQTLF